jgi:hypothetical protein
MAEKTPGVSLEVGQTKKAKKQRFAWTATYVTSMKDDPGGDSPSNVTRTVIAADLTSAARVAEKNGGFCTKIEIQPDTIVA